MIDVATALIACRGLRDAVALGLWGGSLFVAVLAPAPLRSFLLCRGRRALVVAVALLAAVVAALLPVEAAALGGGWSDAADLGLVASLLGDTTIGTAWLAQAAATLVVVAAQGLPPTPRLRVTALAAAGLLGALTLTGHAAMRDGSLGLVQRATMGLHLLAGGFWLGGLVPLLAALPALRDPARHADAALALRRFSGVGHAAVALVIATGAINTALILGRWPLDWASPYQALLCAKIAVVAVMTALALINRYQVVPRFRSDPARALAALRRITLVEVALGLGAVALVAAFGQWDPA